MARRKRRGSRNSVDGVTVEVVSDMVDIFRDSLEAAKEVVLKLDSDQTQIYEVIEQTVQEVYGDMFKLTELIGQNKQNQNQPVFNVYMGDKDAKKAIEDLGGEVGQVKQKLEELSQAVQEKTPQDAQQSPEYQALQDQMSGLSELMEGFGRELEAQRTVPPNYDELRRRIENVEGQVGQQPQDPRILDAYNDIRRRLDEVEGQVGQPPRDERVDWMHDRLTDSVPNQMGELKGRMDTLSDRVNSYIEQDAARQAAQQQAGAQQPGQGAGDGQPPAEQQPPQQPGQPPYGQQPGQGDGQAGAGQRPPQRQGQQRRRRGGRGRRGRGRDFTLDRLAEEYNTSEKFDLPHLEVHSTYRLTKISVSDWPEFDEEIKKYMKFHYKKMFGGDLPDQDAFAKAKQILNKVLESKGQEKGLTGFEYAYNELAREGRLGDVITILRNAEGGQSIDCQRTYVLGQVDPLDWDTHVKLAEEFIEIYGSFMPKNMRFMSVEQLAVNWQRLVLYHAAEKKRVQGILEKYDPAA